MFADDPVGMPLLLKLAKEKPELPFQGLAEELGRATEAWYKDRNLARTEEPTLWVATDKARQLVVLAAEEEAGEGKSESRKQKAESCEHSHRFPGRRLATCRRCGRRSSGSRRGSIRRRMRSSCGGG